jgi:hypothetical protein
LDAPPIVLDFEALIASAAAAIATADPTAICADGTDGFATGAAATFFALTCASSRRGYNADASAAVDADDARAKTTPRACDLPAARRRKVVVVVAHVAFALQLVDAIIVHASRCAVCGWIRTTPTRPRRRPRRRRRRRRRAILAYPFV